MGRQGGFKMNQYELSNAIRQIDGYDLRLKNPRPDRTVEFEQAKEECLQHLQSQLAHVESISFEQYMSERKEKFSKALPNPT